MTSLALGLESAISLSTSLLMILMHTRLEWPVTRLARAARLRRLEVAALCRMPFPVASEATQVWSTKLWTGWRPRRESWRRRGF
ncbi:hypothetical protein K437DRAFT_253295 [Tilletiaria anomala UBC 951]|uniref:Uncharacterized protein n=1 Tax=Tilletiaria anomala (strain ATCC 24038 / CBS 436.72 / UBC 951) TaxID=1037660 RepID=A0A066WRI4_TILAU|nr:uncharacterized protein K437DRAFT_253295 [Tilletiaria anomala UBC 951]KDN53275.1 hypothetical protein K437DRAFT_253295 [Tilletiaria anomala UBC 951]